MAKSSKLRSDFGQRVTTHGDIVVTLRARIVDGKLSAGQRLPTHVMIEKQFHSTPATVAKALYVLKRDGFIRAEKGRGMFVAERLPHLNEYALLFPSSPGSTGGELWSRFFAALVNQAAALSETGPRRLIPFYGMDDGVHAPEYPRLLQRVQAHRLAGIIFASPPFRLVNTPVLDQPGIPRVVLGGPVTQLPHALAVTFSGSFWPKALDYLAARGRKRIAAIAYTMNYGEKLAEVRELVAARGMTLHPCGFMAFHGETFDGARPYVQLLMQSRPDDRPDGLIVADDNMVEHAIAGLIAAGVRVSEELDVVTHCNFPWAGPTVLPVKRLGFDSRAMLWMCIELLDRQRRGESVPEVTKFEAVFEEELPAKSSSPGGRQTWNVEAANH